MLPWNNVCERRNAPCRSIALTAISFPDLKDSETSSIRSLPPSFSLQSGLFLLLILLSFSHYRQIRHPAIPTFIKASSCSTVIRCLFKLFSHYAAFWCFALYICFWGLERAMASFKVRLCISALALFALVGTAAPSDSKSLQSRSSKTSSDKLVFCHFMVCFLYPLMRRERCW